MTKSAVLLPVLFSVVLLAGCQSGPAIDPSPLFARYQGDSVPGAAVMVVQHGEKVFTGTFGMANLDAGIPISTDTNFRLASVTKQFTATAIMMLVERGDLSLDTTLRSIFPAFPAFADRISVRHLLNHTSGLLDYESLIPDSVSRQVLDRDVLQLLEASDSTYFEPGSDYSYSNSGYSVLAMIVENRSGETFPEFLHNSIFAPVGMDASVAYVNGVNDVKNRAFGYSVDGDSIRFSDQSRTSAVLGDGGIYSSLDDLYAWDHVLSTDRLISFDLQQEAYTPGLQNYGFGWRIEDQDGHLRYSHTGSTSGFRNVIQRFPEDELTVIILTNRAGPDVESLATEVSTLYLKP